VIERELRRLVTAVAVAALLVAVAPVSLVAAAAAVTAWLCGWPPRRLYGAALWCLPAVAVWLGASALAGSGTAGVARGPAWYRAADAPYHAWLSMWALAAAGHLAAAAVMVAPLAVPPGLALGGLGWAYRIYRLETGAGGLSPSSAIGFGRRQWGRQVRSARARIAAPGAVPLTHRNGDVVIGATIRAVGHPARAIAALPYGRLRSHQVVIGTTGTGKTTLLLRLWAGFMATALTRQAAGAGRRPLLVVLDCKGGADSRRIADRTRRVLRDAGARSTAIWPDDAALNLWDLPPDRLTSTLLDLVEHGTGSAAYYADVMEAIVELAVQSPGGPPAGSADFLGRLDLDWLTSAYAGPGLGAAMGFGTGPGPGQAEALATLRSGAHLIADVALRFRSLWRRLGPGFDAAGTFADADVWYCILEGTADTRVAEAQARALVDLLTSYVTGPGRGTEALLAVDEFSAVSRRLPIWALYERARSLGLAVQVSAQSWQGLAADEDERYRIAATAEGGIWLLRTPHPGPVVGLAGDRRYVDSSRRLAGGPAWSAEGSSRVQLMPVVDPDLVRGLGVGQVAYVHQGGVSYIQVKRVVAAPPALAGAARVTPPAPAAAAAAGASVAAAAEPRTRAAEVRELAEVGVFLDEAFGPRGPG
jgi:hypothetical protein